MEITRIEGICIVCWENSTRNSKYSDVCDKCLPLTRDIEEDDTTQTP